MRQPTKHPSAVAAAFGGGEPHLVGLGFPDLLVVLAQDLIPGDLGALPKAHIVRHIAFRVLLHVGEGVNREIGGVHIEAYLQGRAAVGEAKAMRLPGVCLLIAFRNAYGAIQIIVRMFRQGDALRLA